MRFVYQLFVINDLKFKFWFFKIRRLKRYIRRIGAIVFAFK